MQRRQRDYQDNPMESNILCKCKRKKIRKNTVVQEEETEVYDYQNLTQASTDLHYYAGKGT